MRKGAALRSLERHAESIAAYQQALRLEPANAQVLAALREVEALQRDSGRNWADDLESSDDDSGGQRAGARAAQPAAVGHKRARAGARDAEPSDGAGARDARARGSRPPAPRALARLQALLEGANASGLRACLLQLGRGDGALCDRACDVLEHLAEGSSEGEGEGEVGSGASSADHDDI